MHPELLMKATKIRDCLFTSGLSACKSSSNNVALIGAGSTFVYPDRHVSSSQLARRFRRHGQRGVTGNICSSPDAIGYDEVTYVAELSSHPARENDAGQFVQPMCCRNDLSIAAISAGARRRSPGCQSSISGERG
jgi:hypothetical protein